MMEERASQPCEELGQDSLDRGHSTRDVSGEKMICGLNRLNSIAQEASVAKTGQIGENVV